MFTNKPITTPNLNEELENLGISDKDMVRLSTGRLDETTSGAMAASIAVIGKSGPAGLGHGEADVEEGDDPIDGKFVTRELFKRIANLPFDAMSESDFDEVLEALADKDIPEGDDEIRGLAEAVVSTLIDARGELTERKKRRRKAGSRSMETVSVMTPAEARKQRQKRRRGPAKAKAKKAAAKRKRAPSAVARRGARIEDAGLASELSALMHENTVASNQWGDTYARVERVFGLIEFITGDEGVSEVLEQALETLSDSLNESSDDSDALAAMKPALKVISKCLESIDSENP